MTNYTKTMREAREEMNHILNENNLEKMRKAAGGAKQTLKMKDGSIGMDSFTASAIMQIYDKVNDKNKKTMENLLKDGKKADIVKLMKFAMSKVNAEYVPEEVELEEAFGDIEDLKKIVKELEGASKMHLGQSKRIQAHVDMMHKEMEEEVELDEAGFVKGKDPLPAGKELAKIMKQRKKGKKEETELDEAKYDLYHKDFSTAMQHAYKMAKKMYGITVDPKEIDDKVASGPRKPSEGKTNSYRLKGDKGAIQVQVYNKGGSKPFELNMYKEEVELDEKLDKEDEPTIKKVVKMLKKASGAHAGQAKDLEKAMTEEDEIDEGKMSQLHQHIKDGKSAKEIAKIMKLDVKTIQALMDEKSELEEKRHRDVDPADIDTSATDDDIKAADKNIMMQLRKSVSLRGQHPVEFLDKKKVKIPQKIAQAVLAKYNSFKKPMDKEKFQAKVAKSHRDLLMALKEDIDENKMTFGTKRIPAAMKKKGMDKVKTPGMAKDKSAGAYIGKMKKESTLERINKKLQENKNG